RVQAAGHDLAVLDEGVEDLQRRRLDLPRRIEAKAFATELEIFPAVRRADQGEAGAGKEMLEPRLARVAVPLPRLDEHQESLGDVDDEAGEPAVGMRQTDRRPGRRVDDLHLAAVEVAMQRTLMRAGLRR